MKIALIGNMNNNNFAIMRYLRNLGADAHLLLTSNDGKGVLSHFKPESDTWEMENWQPYIHQTSIPNVPLAALTFPFSWLVALLTIVRSWMGLQDGWVQPISNLQIIKEFGGYDRYIASGIVPAIFSRVPLQLDIFYPYSIGVEFLSSGEFVNGLNGTTSLRQIFRLAVRSRQAIGIGEARYTFCNEMGPTQSALRAIGVHPIKLAIPMVFSDEVLPEDIPNPRIRDCILLLQRSRFTIMHHARLMWKNPGNFSVVDWKNQNKNNSWLLRAFAELIRLRPKLNPMLVILEYGPDVDLTKQLANELGVGSQIIWLPKMDRRDLMWLMQKIDVGVGEFYTIPKMIWGGTGWEVIAGGKPLLQGFNFEIGEFKQYYGYPPPPMLGVRKEQDILTHLVDMADHPVKREDIGQRAKEWFNRYNGAGLAKQWMELLMRPREGEGEAMKLKAT